MAVTSLDELKKLGQGKEVELIGWDSNPFVCRLKRPSLLSLVSNNKIPNTLLNAAYILFNGAKTQKDVVNLKEQHEIFSAMAEAAMVEPTYAQVKEAGLELTDIQLMEIWNFAQIGEQALASFRAKQQNSENSKNK